MKKSFKFYLICAIALLAAVLTPAAMAQDEKPFAEQKFVLQLSDMDPDKQTLVLNNASNILKYYGEDKADVEIVAYGPGLRLLFAENSNAGRIDGLTKSGIVRIKELADQGYLLVKP